jgi:hypothetical protein
MADKPKTPRRPDSWQRVRHFEYMLPVPLDEALRLLRTPTDYYKDVWLVLATVRIEPESADVTRMAFYTGKQLMFEGYLKVLADGTTLVSGKAPAHLLHQQPEPPLTPEEEQEAKVAGCLYPAMFALAFVCAFLLGDHSMMLNSVLGAIMSVCFVVVMAFIVPAYVGKQHWQAALRQRDDLLIALEKRLGIDAELTK